jgi:large subunit ribosomal protein L10
MNRNEKTAEIEAIRALCEPAELLILTHNKGLTDDMSKQLRRSEGATHRVAKNTLVKLALKGTKFEGLSEHLKGPIGLTVSTDPMAAARVTYNFAKTNDKLVIVAGASSTEILSADKIKYLATLPSLDALRGKIIGILQAPGAQLARLANAYATKDGAAEAAPAETPTA